MASYTSTQTGALTDPSTWGETTRYPGDGVDASDTFTINTGHTVTHSSGNSVSNVSGTVIGVLHILGSMILDGNLTISETGVIEVQGGGNLDINANNIDDDTTGGNKTLTLNGTELNRAVIRDSVGGGRLLVGNNWHFTPINWQYGDIQNLTGDHVFYMGTDVVINHCTFTDSGVLELRLANVGTGIGYSITNSDFYGDGSLNSRRVLYIRDYYDQSSPATRVVDHCLFMSALNGHEIFMYFDNYTFRNCVFINSKLYNVGINFIIEDCAFFAKSEGYNVNMNALYYNVTDSSVFRRNFSWSDIDNPHSFQINQGLNSGAYILDNIWEHTYAQGFTDSGDHVICRESTSGVLTASGNVQIDYRSGMFSNNIGDAVDPDDPINMELLIYHNTIYNKQANYYGCIFRTEAGGYNVGNIELLSNLIVDGDASAGRGINIDNDHSDTINKTDYNCFWNLATSTDIDDRHYGMTHSTLTEGDEDYGANDVAIDPTFYDHTRCLSTWNLQNGSGTESDDDAITYFSRLNGYDSSTDTQITSNAISVDPSGLVSWLRDGFRVTNSSLENAGHDGLTIGAMGYVSSGGGTAITYHFFLKGKEKRHRHLLD